MGLACVLLGTLPSAGGADQPPEPGFVEELLLTRAGHLAVIRTTVDPIRGFHDLHWREVRAQPDGTWQPVVDRRLMETARLRDLDRRGDYELYLAEVQSARRAALDRAAEQGWQPLVPLQLDPAPRAAAEQLAAETVVGRLRVAGINAQVVARRQQGRVQLSVETLPTDGPAKRFIVLDEPIDSVALDGERRVERSPARISAAWATPDTHWIAFQVDDLAPLHAGVRPRRRVIAIATAVLLDALGLNGRALLDVPNS